MPQEDVRMVTVSETAARKLMEAGYPVVYNLRGGVLAWARDVDPDLMVV